MKTLLLAVSLAALKTAMLTTLTAVLWTAGVKLRDLSKDETEGLIFRAPSGPGYVAVMENGEYSLNGISEREAIRQLAVAYFETRSKCQEKAK